LGAEAKAADIKARFGACGFVRGDRILMTRLFQNLLQNALKFHKPGAAAIVRVASEGDAESVKIIFEDEGLGVDPAQADRIFEMFGRGEEAQGVTGYGIGLAVVRRICESQGGSIAIDLAKTEGTRFVITLTRARGRRTPASKT